MFTPVPVRTTTGSCNQFKIFIWYVFGRCDRWYESFDLLALKLLLIKANSFVHSVSETCNQCRLWWLRGKSTRELRSFNAVSVLAYWVGRPAPFSACCDYRAVSGD